MLYRVTLNGGGTRTFDSRPEVGMAGELVCQVDMETVDGLSMKVEPEDVIFAHGEWRSVEPVAESEEVS